MSVEPSAQISAVASDWSELSVRFSAKTGATSGRLPARIYNHFALPLASRAVSLLVNGCAAQDWGQLLMFEGKTCYLSGHLPVCSISDADMVDLLPFRY